MSARAAAFSPACCLLGACVLSVACACAMRLDSALLGLFIGCVLLCWSRPGHIWRRLGEVNIFVAFLWLVVPFSSPGTPLFELGPLTATWQGTRLALLTAIKANAIACVFMSLVSPLSVSGLSCGLRSLHFPDRLSWILLLMGRNISVLRVEWHKLFNAALLRGYSLRASVSSYRVLATMLAILLIRSHERSRILYEAMLLRGFDGSLPFRSRSRWRIGETCLVGACLLGAALIYAASWIPEYPFP